MCKRSDPLLTAILAWSIPSIILLFLALTAAFVPIIRYSTIYDTNADPFDDGPQRVFQNSALIILDPKPAPYLIKNDGVLFLQRIHYRSALTPIFSCWVMPTEADIAAWRREDPALDAAMKRASDRD